MKDLTSEPWGRQAKSAKLQTRAATTVSKPLRQRCIRNPVEGNVTAAEITEESASGERRTPGERDEFKSEVIPEMLSFVDQAVDNCRPV